jgi:S-DNA-T family DNA segregation ATPase FtsK/SpoIIIE
MDEYVSFITNIGNKNASTELTSAISNLLRRGRHAKMHMVLAAQDPTAKNMQVDLGNVTTRMAFTCARFHNSITILGKSGAEKLPGKGAMLFMSSDYPEPIYLQGAYMATEEIEQLVARIASTSRDMSYKFVIPEADMSQSLVFTADALDPRPSKWDERKELAQIVLWVLGHDNISKLQIMRQFKMSNRVNAIMDRLFAMNLVADKFANQPRAVVPMSMEDISDDVMMLLMENGISEDAIAEAVLKRSEQECVGEP